MKNVKLKDLEIINFKGNSNKITFETDRTDISGKNGVGKSIIAQSWYWLLTGYPVYNGLNKELFDNKAVITGDNYKEYMVSVTANVTIDNIDFKIKRTALSKFVRKRGEKEFEKASSDEYAIEVDDIVVSSTNFKSFIEKNICKSNKLMYLIHGSFFTNLSNDKWQSARTILEEIIGTIDQNEFKGDYSDVLDKIELYGSDNLKEQSNNKISKVKSKIDELNTIIKDRELELAAYVEPDWEEKKAELKKVEDSISEIDNKMFQTNDSSKSLIEERNLLMKNINEQEAKKSAIKSSYNKTYESLIKAANHSIDTLQSELSDLLEFNRQAESKKNQLESDIRLNKKELDLLSKNRVLFQDKYKDVKGKMFTENNCAFCGQELPFDKLEEAKAKFDEQKQLELNRLMNDGKINKERFVRLEKKISEQDIEMKELSEQKDTSNIEKKIADKKKAKGNLTNKGYLEDAEYLICDKIISETQTKINSLEFPDLTKLKADRLILSQAKDALNRELGKQGLKAEKSLKISELNKELRNNSNELIILEGFRNKIQEYESEKAAIISYQINKYLDYCKIDVLTKQKDGSFKPNCSITREDGVRYITANTGSKALMDVDIQRMFCKYYGVNMPIFVDDFENLDSDKLPVFENSQIITLTHIDDIKLTVTNL